MTENLLLINGKYFYYDIDAISEFIKISPDEIQKYMKSNKKADTESSTTVINVTKYEMVKTLIDVTLNMGFSIEENPDLDDTEKLIRGVEIERDTLDTMPLPFKMAFNTLTINKIIKTYEPTSRKNKRIDSETKK